MLAQRHLDVLGHRQRAEQRAVLKQHAEMLLELALFSLAKVQNVAAEHLDLSGNRPLQADQRAQQYRFAGAGTADDAQHLAAPDLKVDAVMHGLRAKAVHNAVRANDNVIGLVRHGLDLQEREHDRERGIRHDHQKNRLDDRLRRQSADAVGAARDVEPFVAADERDDRSKERRLDDPDPKGPQANRRMQLVEKGRDQDAERCPGHQTTTEHPHKVGVDDKQRQGQYEPEDAGHDQHLDRIEAEGAQRIDLLIDLHRPELRGEGAPRAAGDDDRSQKHAELAQDRDAEQVDRIDLGAKAPQLVSALISEDDADQERQQADDRHRVDANLFHLCNESRQTQPPRVPHQIEEGQRDQPEKAGDRIGPADQLHGHFADPRDKAS